MQNTENIENYFDYIPECEELIKMYNIREFFLEERWSLMRDKSFYQGFLACIRIIYSNTTDERMLNFLAVLMNDCIRIIYNKNNK